LGRKSGNPLSLPQFVVFRALSRSFADENRFDNERFFAHIPPVSRKLRYIPLMFHQLTNLQIEQELGHRLKQRRLELNLSQAKVAEKIEIKVGVRNDREQEVTSGVAESDEVVIRPPSASANEFK